ncbi:MAG: hypothetical protein ACR2OE_02875 [Thermomicrobiales bacterium]
MTIRSPFWAVTGVSVAGAAMVADPGNIRELRVVVYSASVVVSPSYRVPRKVVRSPDMTRTFTCPEELAASAVSLARIIP